MLARTEIQKITESYGKDVSIGVLASHSGEEVGMAAKAAGLRCIAICEKGRDALYTKYNKNLFSDFIVLDKFKDILKPDVQEKLLKNKVIFLPNRSFSVYAGYDGVENEFRVPIYGSRALLRTEERNDERGQYWLLEQAGIRIPKQFSTADDIDRLAIVKVQQKDKPLERAFFYCTCKKDFDEKSKELISEGLISAEGLKEARIEEFVLGPRFNANFHAYALPELGTIDFLGFEDRRQVNLGGILNLPAQEQLKLDIPITNEEIGHFGITMRESKKHLVYEAAEKFVLATKKEFSPGMIGTFSLQGAISEGKDRKLEFIVFDVSPRIPGCPCVGPTSPEMRRLSLIHGKDIRAPLDLSMIEIKHAAKNRKLAEIIT